MRSTISMAGAFIRKYSKALTWTFWIFSRIGRKKNSETQRFLFLFNFFLFFFEESFFFFFLTKEKSQRSETKAEAFWNWKHFLHNIFSFDTKKESENLTIPVIFHHLPRFSLASFHFRPCFFCYFPLH